MKTNHLMALLSATFLSVAACQKNDQPAPTPPSKKFTLQASMNGLNPVAQSNYSSKWTQMDVIGMIGPLGSDSTKHVRFNNPSLTADGKIAAFTGPSLTEGNFLAYFPFCAIPPNESSFSLGNQVQDAASADHVNLYDFRYTSVPIYIAENQKTTKCTLSHACALLEFKIKLSEMQPGIKVYSVTIHAHNKNGNVLAFSSAFKMIEPGKIVASTASSKMILQINNPPELTTDENKFAAYMVIQSYSETKIPAEYSVDAILSTSLGEVIWPDIRVVTSPSEIYQAGKIYTSVISIGKNN